MPSAEWWEGRPRAAGRLGVCCVFCRQSWEDQDHLDLVCPHDTPRVAGVSGNKTKLRPWSMATSMTMANATHSGGKVESVAIHDFIKSDNGRSRSRLCVSVSGLHSDRVGQSAVAKQGQLAAQAANASAWPAPRESRVDDDGQLSRFALLRLVGLDGSRTSRECSSNTQGGSVSRDGKQPLAITSSRTHAGKLAEATRLHQRHADSPLGCTGKEAQGQISPTFDARPWSVAPKAPLEVIGWPLVTTANSPLLAPPCLDLLQLPSESVLCN